MVSPNPEDPLNSVAANMMEKSPEEFKKFARSYKKWSNSRLSLSGWKEYFDSLL